MVLFFRILLVAITSHFRSRISPTAPARLKLTVLPTDCDLYRHLNNGRYLSLMDLGRLDLVIRAGIGKLMVRNRWFPVVASATIRFRKSIDFLERFELETTLVGWDEKWVWIEQRFVVGDEIRADALLKGVFLEKRTPVPPSRLFAALGLEAEPRHVPEWIAHWTESEEAMKSRERQFAPDPNRAK